MQKKRTRHSAKEGVAGVIFSLDRRNVLLIHRRDVPVWTLPGGGIESGETPQEAIVREILEETGFAAKVTRHVGTYLPLNRLAQKTYLYECKILSGSAKTSSETSQIQFFSLAHLPEKIPPPFREWIREGRRTGPPIIRYLTSVNYRAFFYYTLRHPFLIFRFLLAKIGLPINSNEKKGKDKRKESK